MRRREVIACLTVLVCLKCSKALSSKAVLNSTTSISLHLLAVLPLPNLEQSSKWNNSYYKPIPKWERGPDILLGGLLAENEINNSTDILTGYHLEVVPLQIPMCDPTSAGISEFVNILTSNKYNLVGVTGLLCNKLTRFISHIAGHEGSDLIQIASGATVLPLDEQRQYSHLYYMLPSSEIIARTFVRVMMEFGWSRIGILSSGMYHDTRYVKTAEKFVNLTKESGFQIAFHGEMITNKYGMSVQSLLKELFNSGTNIVFAFLPPVQTSAMICSAYLENMKWPQYAWIFAEVDIDEITHIGTNCNQSVMSVAVENILLTCYHIKPQDVIATSDKHVTSYREALKTLSNSNTTNSHEINPYANVLYDSVWAFALAMNVSLNTLNKNNFSLGNFGPGMTEVIEHELNHLSFFGATGLVSFNQNSSGSRHGVNIPAVVSQIQSGTAVHIGVYHSSSDAFVLNISLLSVDQHDLPSDKLERVYKLYPLYLDVLLTLLIVMCTFITTILLVLLLYYRKEPEIKASSISLSLCIFIGCYISLLASLCQTVTSGIAVPIVSEKNARLSAVLPCFSYPLAIIGSDLILVTVFAKTLRIYHIFTKFGRVGKICSDSSLLVLIISVVLGKVLIFIVWAVADVNHLVDNESLQTHTTPPHYSVTQYCVSNHTIVWLVLVYGYMCILLLLLLLVALKTRKIKRVNYKDTKKLNALIVTFLVLIILCTFLWALLRLTGNSIESKLMASIAYCLSGVFCPLFLFVPKVVSPLKRHIRKHFSHMCY